MRVLSKTTMRVIKLAFVIAVLSGACACSRLDSFESRKRGESASALSKEDVISAYGGVENERGEVVSLPGFKPADAVRARGQISADDVTSNPDAPVFTYQSPAEANETSFSEPQMVTSSFLRLSLLANGCEGLSYSSAAPLMKNLPAIRGSVYYCIKLGLKDGESVYLRTPPLMIDNAPAQAFEVAGSPITINGGATHTVNRSVTLDLAADGAKDRYITNSKDCADGGEWQAYDHRVSWELAQSNSVATVYVRFRAGDGGTSSCFSASIIHDDQAPAAPTISIAGGTTHTASLSVTLALSASGSDMYVTNTSGCGSGGVWEAYAATKTNWPLAQANSTAIVYAKVRDVAGNESGCGSATITHDAQAPAAGVLTINAGALYTTSASVNLVLAGSSSQMLLNNSSDCSGGGSWEAFATNKTWLLNPTNAVATVSAKLRDEAGNESACFTAAITHDSVAPTPPSTFIDGLVAPDGISSPTLSWAGGNDAGSGLASYEVALGSTPGGADMVGWSDVGSAASTTFSGLSLSLGQTYYASLRAYDRAGNVSSVVQGDGFVYGWAQEAYIKPSSNDSGDRFGGAVALDGDTLAVSATGEDSGSTTIINGTLAASDNSFSSAGAVFVYKRTAASWAQQAYIKAANAAPDDYFGSVIALKGDTLAVAVDSQDSPGTTITNGTGTSYEYSLSNSGAVYVYRRTASSWAQEAFVKAKSSTANLSFGEGVAVGNDILAVGARPEGSPDTTITNGTTVGANTGLGGSGAVFIYRRAGTTWDQEAFIKASNPKLSAGLGSPLSFDGDTLAVSASSDSSPVTTITNGTGGSTDTSLYGAGAVYVFGRSGAIWSEQAYIKASNTDMSDFFGDTISLQGETLAVSSYDDSTDTTITNGPSASTDNNATEAGAVFVYKRTATTWTQQAYIKPSNMGANDQFGLGLGFSSNVAVDGDLLAVGAAGEDSSQTTISYGTAAASDNAANGTGAVYIFRRTGTTWSQQAYIKAINAQPYNSFGGALAFSGTTLAVGAQSESSNQRTITNGTTASNDTSSSGSGAVYIYRRSN